MYIRVTQASAALAIALACSGLHSSFALAQEGMRPVPRFSGTSIRDQRTDAQKAAASTNLKWRVSREVAPPAPPQTAQVPVEQAPVAQAAPAQVIAATPAQLVAIDSDQTADAVQLKPLSSQAARTQAISPVLRTRYQNQDQTPGDAGGFALPQGLQPQPQSNTANDDSLAETLFGDDAPAPLPPPTLELPNAAPPLNNSLRDPAAPPVLPPAEEAAPTPLPMPVPMQEETLEQTPDETLPPEDMAPTEAAPQPPRETLDFDAVPESEPSDEATGRENPFPRTRSNDEVASSLRDDDELMRRPLEFSCDRFRKSISEATIQTVSLDISPPFRPDVIVVDEYQTLKTKFEEAQEVRDWQSIDGRKLGRGRLRDLAYEKVIIETEFGTTEELPINRISEADLAYLSKNWGLPQECLIEQVAYQERSWQHSKVTWKASNLCHKPLYFEDVNLERYGHDAGPFAQPIISSAHFFANIAVLPYKMGVHQPSECQYTLGYYRPGNCAPWIVPPVPISLRGGLYQAAAMTGAFWLIP
jgi:hypothetical protein